jgi:hypothetical protein
MTDLTNTQANTYTPIPNQIIAIEYNEDNIDAIVDMLDPYNVTLEDDGVVGLEPVYTLDNVELSFGEIVVVILDVEGEYLESLIMDPTEFCEHYEETDPKDSETDMDVIREEYKKGVKVRNLTRDISSYNLSIMRMGDEINEARGKRKDIDNEITFLQQRITAEVTNRNAVSATLLELSGAKETKEVSDGVTA